MYKQVIVARTDLKMGKGKIAAQCCHASIEAFRKTVKKNPDEAQAWLDEGQAKIVLKIESEKELIELFMQVKNLIPASLITDAGHTQIEPGTKTCLGIGPAKETEIDKFTGKLKLL